jgi:hypothetical protein
VRAIAKKFLADAPALGLGVLDGPGENLGGHGTQLLVEWIVQHDGGHPLQLGGRDKVVQVLLHRFEASEATREPPHDTFPSRSSSARSRFVRAFVGGVRVVPSDALLEVQMRTLPAVGSLLPANSTCGLVAGAGFEPATFGL